jgi:hypothetical protein
MPNADFTANIQHSLGFRHLGRIIHRFGKRCVENLSSAAGDAALRVVGGAAEWVYLSWLFYPSVAFDVLKPLGELDYATPNRSGNHNL